MQQFNMASAHGRAFAHIAQFHPELTAFRRDLHAHPELGFEEVYTSGRVKQAMALCSVDEIQTGFGKKTHVNNTWLWVSLRPSCSCVFADFAKNSFAMVFIYF